MAWLTVVPNGDFPQLPTIKGQILNLPALEISGWIASISEDIRLLCVANVMNFFLMIIR